MTRVCHASRLRLLARWNRTLQWRHNGYDGVSNHQPHSCLLNRLFRRRSKKTSKLRVTALCEGNSPVTGEFPAQRAGKAENVSIWRHRHVRGTNYFIQSMVFETNCVQLIPIKRILRRTRFLWYLVAVRVTMIGGGNCLVWILIWHGMEQWKNCHNIPALVQIMAWRRPGDKPLSEPMMGSLLAHICVARPQWVNRRFDFLLMFYFHERHFCCRFLLLLSCYQV